MMAADDAARIREACGALGQLDAFAIGGSARTILVACMEIGACYAVNLWCDAPELANGPNRVGAARIAVGRIPQPYVRAL